MNTQSHHHFHTHVNTHFCGCGATHVTAHTHVRQYEVMPSLAKVAPPTIAAAPTNVRSPSPVARRTRSKLQRATWENTTWAVADKDVNDLLDFLRKSDDPWERSLIPAVEKDAIDRMAKRAKKATV